MRASTPTLLALACVLATDRATSQQLAWHDTNQQAGTCADLSRDFDGDGLADAVLGDKVAQTVEVRSGLDGHSLMHLPGPASFGSSIATMPDLDGDAIPEIIASSFANFYVLSGWNGSTLYAESLGASVPHFESLGDVNGDGFADLALASLLQGGFLRVYSGAFLANGTGTAILWSVAGTGPATGWGADLASPGDVDGDGIADIVVSSPMEEGNVGFTAFRGRLRCYSGATGALLWLKNFWNAMATSTLFFYGVSLDGGEDFDGDGIGDLVVGAPGVDWQATGGGAVFVVSGLGGTLLTIEGSVAHGALGEDVQWVGDQNQDGTPDILVGRAGLGLREVHLYSGATEDRLAVYAGYDGMGLREQLAGGVDTNGDGRPDFLFSASDTATGGHAWLYRNECGGNVQAYCVGAPNSYSPEGGRIWAVGSASISENFMALQVSQCPVNQPGIFFYGANQAQVPFGDGFRCVANPLLRLSPAVTTNATGEAGMALDLAAPPFDAGQGQLTPGSRWNFQYWVRDPAAGGAGHTLTNGVAVTFCQ